MSTRSLGVIVAVAALVGSVVPVLTQGPGGGRGGGQAVSLPDGPGKDLAQTQCTKCHALNLLANSGGYTRQGWEELFSTMVSLPKDQSAVLADYLAKNFPETPRPKAVIVPGSVQVNIKEWVVPTLGSRPRSPNRSAESPIGTKTSATVLNWKFAGVTPITVKLWLLSVIGLPKTLSSAPNLRCQNP